MAARRKKSSKRSATKPTERLEPPLTCIVDEYLGRYAVPEALRAAGLDTSERDAMEAAKLRVFALSAANLSGDQQAAAFIRALPKIRRLASNKAGPFIARVTATGAVDLT